MHGLKADWCGGAVRGDRIRAWSWRNKTWSVIWNQELWHEGAKPTAGGGRNVTVLSFLSSKHVKLLICYILVLISEGFLSFCLPKRMLLFVFSGVHDTFPRAADALSCSESFNFLVRSQHFWQQQRFIWIIPEERSRSALCFSHFLLQLECSWDECWRGADFSLNIKMCVLTFWPCGFEQ